MNNTIENGLYYFYVVPNNCNRMHLKYEKNELDKKKKAHKTLN